jgi:hypothetical protein
MYRRFFGRTALITAFLCALFGAYQAWEMFTGDFARGWFGLLASQRDLAYVAGLVLPLSAFLCILTADKTHLPSGRGALVLSLGTGGIVLVLMMGLSPLFETVMMRAALFGAELSRNDGTVVPTPSYTAQGWWHWWGVYAAGNARVADMLGLGLSDAKPFWRSAGLLAWQPMFISATAVLTTLLGVELAGRLHTRVPVERGRRFAALILVQATLLAGWKCARVLTIQFDVPPEGALALLVIGPGLLLCGVLLLNALGPTDLKRDA